MSSWLGWLLILGGVYCIVVAVRAIIEFSSWCMEEFFSRVPEGPLESDDSPGHDSERHAASARPPQETDDDGGYSKWLLVFAARITMLHWLAPLAEFGRMLVYKGRYDYWIGRTLVEDDARKKVKYVSKALALDPGYVPGWGLKANALLALKRYDEALECVEKTLALAPNPIAWYEKGLCCHHLQRYEEALRCFDKALAGCSAKNTKLREDATRAKRLCEACRP
jgi:hypothetical protein